jgi:hypothetical protein
MDPDRRPQPTNPNTASLRTTIALLVATNEDLATFFEVTRPQHRMPRRAEDRYHRAAFAARHSGLHLLAVQQAAPELELHDRGLAGRSGYRGPVRNCRRRRVPSRRVTRTAAWPRLSGDSAPPISDQGRPFAQMAIKDVVVRRVHCAWTRRALLRRWPHSRMTMLYVLRRRPEFCHPEFRAAFAVASRQARKE